MQETVSHQTASGTIQSFVSHGRGPTGVAVSFATHLRLPALVAISGTG